MKKSLIINDFFICLIFRIFALIMTESELFRKYKFEFINDGALCVKHWESNFLGLRFYTDYQEACYVFDNSGGRTIDSFGFSVKSNIDFFDNYIKQKVREKNLSILC